MAKVDEQVGKRVRIRWGGENHYLYVSDTDIIFSGPRESDVSQQDKYSTINLIWRLVSICRNSGVPWAKILKQFDAAAGGKRWYAISLRLLGGVYEVRKT